MNRKASFLGSFAHLLHRNLCWLLLLGSLFLLVQCGGSRSSSSKGESGTPNLVILETEINSQNVEIGDNLTITLTVKDQDTGSGNEVSSQMVTFYRSDNKFISPRDEVLGTSPLDPLDTNGESNPSFSFLARAGDNYYGACLGISSDCQIGVSVSVPSPDIPGSGYTYISSCELSRADGSRFTISGASRDVVLDNIGDTFTDSIDISQDQEKYYLLYIKEKGILDIWTTGSVDTVSVLFSGTCNEINGHYYADNGGVGGENNFQISATAEGGYYFLVVHEKSLNAATFDITAILSHPPRVIGEDPLYSDQWHLNNPNDIDINAPEAWDITRGKPEVLVAVVDDRVEVTHPDLAPNHDDRYDNFDPPGHEHGTTVAGLIAAKGNNGIGVSGVAPEVGFISLVATEFGATYKDYINALIRYKEQVAISNNSWGIPDGIDGHFFSSDSYAIYRTTLEEGVTNGYGGKGIFYVFATGNRAHLGNNANYAPPARYYSVAATCAVTKDGRRASYSEKGANLWVCAPGGELSAGLTTTDITGMRGYNKEVGPKGDYADDFTGTSASTPIVSGVAALMRSANPELGWRDIRLILAATAKKIDTSSGWFEGVASYDGSKSGSARYADTNTKYNHNHEYGFGLVNAQAAVSQSQNWNNVGEMVVSSFQSKNIPIAEQLVPDGDPTGLSSVLKVTGLNDILDFIEYIDIEIKINGKHYGNLQINLISPANKTSTLAEEHHCVYNTLLITCAFDPPTKVSFGSARHLGESPDGDWTLKVVDKVTRHNNNVYSWGLKFYGHKKP